MKISSVFFLLLSLISLDSRNVFSSDATGVCLASHSVILDEKTEGLTECQKAIVALKVDPDYDKKFRANINQKMAKLAALQTKQIMQDLSASSDFYEHGSKSFLLSDKVKNSCKFDIVAQLEKNGCNGKSSKSEEKKKLKMLADVLGESDSFKPRSAMDAILHVYGSSKYGYGFDDPEMNQCPISGSAFSLNSQITESTAQTIINKFLEKNNDANIETTYIKYSQLSMIKEADKENPGFQNKFENYIKNFDPKKSSAKNYFSAFFFSEENKKILGDGVARRCEQVRATISSFVCQPLEKVTSDNPKVAGKLFNGFDPSSEFSEQDDDVKDNDKDHIAYKAYAYTCDEKSSLQKLSKAQLPQAVPVSKGIANIDCLSLDKTQQNVDNWYKCFTDGVKAEDSKANSDYTIKQFCDRYSCKSPDVISANSCKNGGPLSSEDLAGLKLKDDDILKQILYIKTLEKHAKDKADYLAMMNAINTGTPIKEDVKKSISDFDMNAFGADAAAKLVGLPSTPIVLAQISQDMKDKGITPTTPEQVQKIVNREPTQSSDEMFGNDLAQNNNTLTVPAISNNYAGNSFMNPTPETSHITGVHSANKVADANTTLGPSSSNEVDQMKKDLKTLMDAQKSPSKTLVENDSSPAVEDSTSPTPDYSKSYAKELAARERQVSERESVATSRENSVWAREREQQRREEELSRREKDLDEKNRGPEVQAAQASAVATSDRGFTGNTTDAKAAKLSQDKEDLKASHNGLTVTPDRLVKLDTEDLTNLGVNIEAPFIIRVNVRGKLVSVRVAKVKKDNGEAYLEPQLNEDSKEVREAILRSPIFREFRYHLDQKKSSYSPVKKIKK